MLGKSRLAGNLIFLVLLFVFPVELLQASQVDASNIAVIINKDDPLSVAIGDYYIQQRAIPQANVIQVKLGPAKNALPVSEFKSLADEIKRRTPVYIQAYVIAWPRPYRVACMSITSAISLGFDRRYCAQGCHVTRKSEYYNSTSRMPFADYHIRPSMLLAARTFDVAKQLIDSGVKSDYSRPAGDVYLLDTSDRSRNVRSRRYTSIVRAFGNVLPVHIVKGDWIRSKLNVLAYFTGSTSVQHLDSVKFLPGAVADHLTSAGGVLYGNKQMSSMRWLEMGATASYGTVAEPCNYPAKFPDPMVLMRHYLDGDTVLEAYWKSVLMPGQGLFIGEPLASPYKGCRLLASSQGRLEGLQNEADTLPVLRRATRCNLFMSH